MSASPNPPGIPPESPLSTPARPVKPPESPPRWPAYVLLATVVVAGAWWLRPHPPKPVVAPWVSTVRAPRGIIQATRRLAGSISARRFMNIGAPVLQAPDQGDRKS